jgi:hypothetical protein
MFILYLIASPFLFILGALLLFLAVLFYPFYVSMLDVLAWVLARF